jgi:uncharacterized protein YjcR
MRFLDARVGSRPTQETVIPKARLVTHMQVTGERERKQAIDANAVPENSANDSPSRGLHLIKSRHVAATMSLSRDITRQQERVSVATGAPVLEGNVGGKNRLAGR